MGKHALHGDGKLGRNIKFMEMGTAIYDYVAFAIDEVDGDKFNGTMR